MLYCDTDHMQKTIKTEDTHVLKKYSISLKENNTSAIYFPFPLDSLWTFCFFLTDTAS